MLPDELVLRIFYYIPGYELGGIAQVCKRFYLLTNDNKFWKGIKYFFFKKKIIFYQHSLEICTQYWNIENEEEENEDEFSPKTFYINKLRSFLHQKQEAKLLGVLSLFRTTIPYYFFLFLFSVEIYFIGLKLDGYINWLWVIVFIPMWVVDLILLSVVGFIISYWINKTKEMEGGNFFLIFLIQKFFSYEKNFSFIFSTIIIYFNNFINYFNYSIYYIITIKIR